MTQLFCQEVGRFFEGVKPLHQPCLLQRDARKPLYESNELYLCIRKSSSAKTLTDSSITIEMEETRKMMKQITKEDRFLTLQF